MPFLRFFQFTFFTCLLSFLASCELINPAEPIPGYIKIDNIDVYTNEAVQGSSASKLSDVWVTVNGEALGAYELPATIPVLSEGYVQVKLYPGILLNGIAGTRSVFNAMNPYDTSFTMEPGSIHHLLPKVTYKSTTRFPLIEDFDHSSLAFEKAAGSDTLFEFLQGTDAFENKSGAIYLDTAHSYFEVVTRDTMNLPGAFSPVYIEINYKTEAEFTVGAITNTIFGEFRSDLLVVRPAAEWKKIYVNMTPAVSNTFSANGWKIYFYGRHNNSNTGTKLFFDNIKVVY